MTSTPPVVHSLGARDGCGLALDATLVGALG
jgi:hypothetical protein